MTRAVLGALLSHPHRYSTRVASGVLNQETLSPRIWGMWGRDKYKCHPVSWPSKSARVIFYPHDAPPMPMRSLCLLSCCRIACERGREWQEMISDPNVPNTEHAWQSNGTCLEELMRGLASPFGKAVARVHVCARCAAACLPHPKRPHKV
jgi:hypothetical protein